MKRHLRGKRVLIVEDNPVLAFEIKDSLSEVGALAVGPALDLESGLKHARHDNLDAAVLDIQLGDHDRVWPLALELKRHNVPVVFVSGTCTRKFFPSDLKEEICLEKPASQEEILDQVGRLLAA